MAPQDNDLLTPLEAAALLRVAPSTLVRWRRHTRASPDETRHGPDWVEIGTNLVRYKRSTLNAFIEAREQRANG